MIIYACVWVLSTCTVFIIYTNVCLYLQMQRRDSEVSSAQRFLKGLCVIH